MRPTLSVLLLAMQLLPGAQAQAAGGLKVHEWGTFTSVQGSNGEPLTGLEHEEEALPSFVHGRDTAENTVAAFGCPKGCKSCCKGSCCDDFVSLTGAKLAVTQKMETPVLYFYSDRPAEVDVTVDFPQGVISQYYPRPTSFLPPLGSGTPLAGGRIHYSRLQVLTEKAPVPAVAHGNVYAPARATRSNVVRSDGENEKFVFYRGLGNFRTSLKVTSDAQSLRLGETQGRAIPYVLALNIRGGRGAFQELGGLGAHETRALPLKRLLSELAPSAMQADFERAVGPKLVAALVRSGLYEDEARAMVNTWRASYFRTDGLRVLYILSREETDAILPIKISPEPQELVRTLVGRVEVLTTAEESELLGKASEAASLHASFDRLAPLGRFKEPKLLRLQQLSAGAGENGISSFIANELHR